MKALNVGLAAGMLLLNASAAKAVEPQLESAIARGEYSFTHNMFGGAGKVCASCHLGAGREQGRLPNGKEIPSLMNAAAIFPRIRNGRLVTLSDQIRGCVENALNGTPPEYGGDELNDLTGYITSLSEGRAINLGGAPR